MAYPEYEQVERPLVAQLERMGWEHLEGAPVATVPSEPSRTDRGSFAEVLLAGRLRKALRRINRGPDGGEWLDDDRLATAVNALSRNTASKLLEANQVATERLLSGVAVEGLPGWDGGRSQTLHYVDWENPGNNAFIAVSQFRVDRPGTGGYITPDMVLFVNGIPLVVVECKAPGEEALAEAVRQLRRYANQRVVVSATGETSGEEGVEKLFHTSQLLVATRGDRARIGTITSGPEHFTPWGDPYPRTREDLAEDLGTTTGEVTAQQVLAAGVLRPENLLAIVRNFVLFTEAEGRRVKVAPRYQQYRAVFRAVEQLRSGRTRDAGTASGQDERGGIVWHTQGSGKSFTMVYLVRVMRSLPELRRFKVVIVTDRTDLQEQLRETAGLTGDTVHVAGSVARVKELLARKGPGIVFAMIQKYRDTDTGGEQPGEDLDEETGDRRRGDGLGDEATPSLGTLNDDDSILALVDEAHRSHTSALHANLLTALPNCARIGFTGTPIIMGQKKRTHEIFGSYIDRYTIKESENDGATLPILYEGRTTKGAVNQGRDLDDLFEDMFADHSEEQREQLQRRYATSGSVLEAPKLIHAKARDMLRHYVSTVLLNGFKAQLVAVSRLATVRYREALNAARDELVAEIEALDPADLNVDDPASLPSRREFLVRAYAHLPLLRAMDFVPVISGSHNDPLEWSNWTQETKQRNHIAAFKRSFSGDSESVTGRPVAFLIVKSMLLTGFDAPVEQALYLDRGIREAELLQAIARVNRIAHNKTAGLIVDYYGVANHLEQALAAYSRDDISGALRNRDDELGTLDARRNRVRHLFTSRGVTPARDETSMESCVQLLADPALRDRFDADLKAFLASLDAVLPLPDAKPYIADAKLFGEIQLRMRRRYRDRDEFDPSLYGEKVRALIDEHIISLDIEQKLPPISVTAPDFTQRVGGLVGERAKASEMEHALRAHITKAYNQDPARYDRLSERLEQILESYQENWAQQIQAFQEMVDELQRTQPEQDESGLPSHERPFYGLLVDECAGDSVLERELEQRLQEASRDVVEIVREHIGIVDFWHNAHAQKKLVDTLTRYLINHDMCPIAESERVADRLFEVARANRERLVGQD